MPYGDRVRPDLSIVEKPIDDFYTGARDTFAKIATPILATGSTVLGFGITKFANIFTDKELDFNFWNEFSRVSGEINTYSKSLFDGLSLVYGGSAVLKGITKLGAIKNRSLVKKLGNYYDKVPAKYKDRILPIVKGGAVYGATTSSLTNIDIEEKIEYLSNDYGKDALISLNDDELNKLIWEKETRDAIIGLGFGAVGYAGLKTLGWTYKRYRNGVRLRNERNQQAKQEFFIPDDNTVAYDKDMTSDSIRDIFSDNKEKSLTLFSHAPINQLNKVSIVSPDYILKNKNLDDLLDAINTLKLKNRLIKSDEAIETGGGFGFRITRDETGEYTLRKVAEFPSGSVPIDKLDFKAFSISKDNGNFNYIDFEKIPKDIVNSVNNLNLDFHNKSLLLNLTNRNPNINPKQLAKFFDNINSGLSKDLNYSKSVDRAISYFLRSNAKKTDVLLDVDNPMVQLFIGLKGRTQVKNMLSDTYIRQEAKYGHLKGLRKDLDSELTSNKFDEVVSSSAKVTEVQDLLFKYGDSSEEMGDAFRKFFIKENYDKLTLLEKGKLHYEIVEYLKEVVNNDNNFALKRSLLERSKAGAGTQKSKNVEVKSEFKSEEDRVDVFIKNFVGENAGSKKRELRDKSLDDLKNITDIDKNPVATNTKVLAKSYELSLLARIKTVAKVYAEGILSLTALRIDRRIRRRNGKINYADELTDVNIKNISKSLSQSLTQRLPFIASKLGVKDKKLTKQLLSISEKNQKKLDKFGKLLAKYDEEVKYNFIRRLYNKAVDKLEEAVGKSDFQYQSLGKAQRIDLIDELLGSAYALVDPKSPTGLSKSTDKLKDIEKLFSERVLNKTGIRLSEETTSSLLSKVKDDVVGASEAVDLMLFLRGLESNVIKIKGREAPELSTKYKRLIKDIVKKENSKLRKAYKELREGKTDELPTILTKDYLEGLNAKNLKNIVDKVIVDPKVKKEYFEFLDGIINKSEWNDIAEYFKLSGFAFATLDLREIIRKGKISIKMIKNFKQSSKKAIGIFGRIKNKIKSGEFTDKELVALFGMINSVSRLSYYTGRGFVKSSRHSELASPEEKEEFVNNLLVDGILGFFNVDDVSSFISGGKKIFSGEAFKMLVLHSLEHATAQTMFNTHTLTRLFNDLSEVSSDGRKFNSFSNKTIEAVFDRLGNKGIKNLTSSNAVIPKIMQDKFYEHLNSVTGGNSTLGLDINSILSIDSTDKLKMANKDIRYFEDNGIIDALTNPFSEDIKSIQSAYFKLLEEDGSGIEQIRLGSEYYDIKDRQSYNIVKKFIGEMSGFEATSLYSSDKIALSNAMASFLRGKFILSQDALKDSNLKVKDVYPNLLNRNRINKIIVKLYKENRISKSLEGFKSVKAFENKTFKEIYSKGIESKEVKDFNQLLSISIPKYKKNGKIDLSPVKYDFKSIGKNMHNLVFHKTLFENFVKRTPKNKQWLKDISSLNEIENALSRNVSLTDKSKQEIRNILNDNSLKPSQKLLELEGLGYGKLRSTDNRR